jgi:hypothetical protein
VRHARRKLKSPIGTHGLAAEIVRSRASISLVVMRVTKGAIAPPRLL